MPTVDHGLDEDHIWAFNSTGYNQSSIRNGFTKGVWDMTTRNHVPFWGIKLAMPRFFREEKLEKFYRQWGVKLDLEKIKMRQAIEAMTSTEGITHKMRTQFKEEIQSYIS